MKFNQTLVLALMAVASAVAVSQELDPSETMQARNLAMQAAQRDRAVALSRAVVVAETRSFQARGELKQVGELSEAPVSVAETQVATSSKTRAEVREELAQWQSTHKVVVGEFSGDPTLSSPTTDAVGQRPQTWAQVKARFAKRHEARPIVVGAASAK